RPQARRLTRLVARRRAQALLRSSRIHTPTSSVPRASRCARTSASTCCRSRSRAGRAWTRSARTRSAAVAATSPTCTCARPRPAGRHIWETNFVPDLRTLELKRWEERGGGSSNIVFALADGTMHAHISEIPVGTYKKAHRHGADFHVFTVSGHGYSLYWHEG